MTSTLEQKLSLLLWYLSERRAGRHSKDTMGFNHLMDDPEIVEWLDKKFKAGLITNTCFVNRVR